MKPAVAKVVNPLGTVVNVHSDDNHDIEPIEENVIHENCDESLFRPFVTSKTVAYHQKLKHYGDDILTKSLEGTTEVTVKLKRSSDKVGSKSREISPANSKIGSDIECLSRIPKQGNNGPNKKITSIHNSRQYDDSLSSVSKFQKIKTNKIVHVDPIDNIDAHFTHHKNSLLDITPPPPPHIDNEDYFSLENIAKIDTFEDAVDCDENSVISMKKDKQANHKIPKLHDEEDINEEKFFAKKTRKPKTKLGVKIVNINTEVNKVEKTIDVHTADVTLITPPKRSWSSITATKSAETLLIDSKDKDNIRAICSVEFHNDFNVTLPKTPNISSTDLVDINTPQEHVKKNIGKNPLDVSTDAILLKIDRSSDDEKGESSSSQAEITESDDSGKVPDVSVFEDLTESRTINVSKSSSRRKKKRK